MKLVPASMALLALGIAACGSTVPESASTEEDLTSTVFGTGGSTLNVRHLPWLTSHVVATVPPNTSVDIECQTTGENINGNAIWDYLPRYGGFAADAFLWTGHNGFVPGMKRCKMPDSAASPAPPTSATPTPTGSCDGNGGGSWEKFGGGQCLVAIQQFYPAQFGVSIPVARSSWTGNCAPQGACHIWVDDIPDPAQWERIPNDGTSLPSTYDVIVYAPTSGNPWGHIAAVDRVVNGQIHVMDSNWNMDERRASAPHLAPLVAYGWYHLKRLPKRC